jgi:hypothetical protein
MAFGGVCHGGPVASVKARHSLAESRRCHGGVTAVSRKCQEGVKAGPAALLAGSRVGGTDAEDGLEHRLLLPRDRVRGRSRPDCGGLLQTLLETFAIHYVIPLQWVGSFCYMAAGDAVEFLL